MGLGSGKKSFFSADVKSGGARAIRNIKSGGVWAGIGPVGESLKKMRVINKTMLHKFYKYVYNKSESTESI